jgi:hypothetical protein
MFVMVTGGVLFEIRTEFLNNIYTSFVFKGLNLNSVNQLIFVIKCGVLFEVRTEFLNNIYTSFVFKGLNLPGNLLTKLCSFSSSLSRLVSKVLTDTEKWCQVTKYTCLYDALRPMVCVTSVCPLCIPARFKQRLYCSRLDGKLGNTSSWLLAYKRMSTAHPKTNRLERMRREVLKPE